MFTKCPFDYRGKDEAEVPIFTRSTGEPVGNFRTILTAGPQGPALFEDHVMFENMQHTMRTRTNERLFHAHGTGVHGYFEVTNDITKYCAADFLKDVGKRTPVFTRFSLGLSQLGVSETSGRGLRGMGIRFYTQEGNYDLTMLSEPPFLSDDPMTFLPGTNAGGSHVILNNNNLPDFEAKWDFFSKTPSNVHFQLYYYSDTALSDGYRHMDMFGINTYKFINRHGEFYFVRHHVLTDQGVRLLTPQQATQLAGANPDYCTQDLIEAIERGDYPSWTISIQVMTLEQAESWRFNPFDTTKLWSTQEFPLIEMGRVTMNRIVSNHWDETEQVAFNPGNFVPGIRASPDKWLQARIFAYSDELSYRLGPNRNQLPINRPLNPVANYDREGAGVFVSQAGAPHYFPNSFGGPAESERAMELDPPHKQCGDVKRYEDDNEELHFIQPRDYWQNVLTEDHRKRVVANIVVDMQTIRKSVRERACDLFARVDEDIAERIRSEFSD